MGKRWVKISVVVAVAFAASVANRGIWPGHWVTAFISRHVNIYLWVWADAFNDPKVVWRWLEIAFNTLFYSGLFWFVSRFVTRQSGEELKHSMRSVVLKSGFTMLAALAATALATTGLGMALQYGKFPTPGIYVFNRLHSDPESTASLGSFLRTVIAVDGTCWFIVLCAVGWWLMGKTARAKARLEWKRDIPVAFCVFCACLLIPAGTLVLGHC